MRATISLGKLFVLVTLWSVVCLVTVIVDRLFNGEESVSDKAQGLRNLLNFQRLNGLKVDSSSASVPEEDMESYTPVSILGLQASSLTVTVLGRPKSVTITMSL